MGQSLIPCSLRGLEPIGYAICQVSGVGCQVSVKTNPMAQTELIMNPENETLLGTVQRPSRTSQIWI
ncbi:hypothetical protein D1AOALGA4SA_10946 [Olavius algarvensis Delta 1 endosymbiont]|nr:hypothetical protein D1AOALGA4SA_10946 [Olavius algarvensis Delta 1 endosymbiont]